MLDRLIAELPSNATVEIGHYAESLSKRVRLGVTHWCDIDVCEGTKRVIYEGEGKSAAEAIAAAYHNWRVINITEDPHGPRTEQ